MKFIPFGERVLVKQLKGEEKTKSGIYLPKAEERKEGIVIEVGSYKDGGPLPIKKNDHIIYSGYSSEEFEVNGEKFLIIEFKDVLGKVENS